ILGNTPRPELIEVASAGALGLDRGRARARHLGLLGGDELRAPGASPSTCSTRRATRISSHWGFQRGHLGSGRALINHAVATIAWYFRAYRPRSGGRFACRELAIPDPN